MNESYSPGPGVEPQPPYDTAFLSERDLGLNIPLNYVTRPGVSLAAACFSRRRYEDFDAETCFTNLLAVGFRRLEIDVYWDDARNVWSFCPVKIPTSIPNAVPSSTTTLSFTPSSLTPLASTAVQASGSSANLLVRQASSTPVAAFTTALTSSQGSLLSESSLSTSSTTSSSASKVSIIPDSASEPLIAIGPYTCTTTINLSTFTTLLENYIHYTNTNLAANIVYVILNLHAAASDQSPTSPAPQPSTLPQESNFLGTLFSGELSSYLYTRDNLQSDRSNLNGSWYTVDEDYRPADGYYTLSSNENDIFSTQNGWPSESFVELTRSKRLLVGWGSVDPQMAGYNFSGDVGIVFPAGYIQDVQVSISADSEGRLENGCYLRDEAMTVAQDNSSWAVEANVADFSYPILSSADLMPLLNLTSSTTNCGISPSLNVTLLDSPANDNYIPYQNYTYSTIWSWAPGEPKNHTGEDSDLFRCATISASLGGRWLVDDCPNKYYAACRLPTGPYNWTVTTYAISYSFAQDACEAMPGYVFAAPRTALENSYLTDAVRKSSRDYDGHGVWVDFNSLDVVGCWTVGGPNATCPYSQTVAQLDDLRKRVILVPTIAAVIVLILTALTVFVKAAGNRRTKKRGRKRANNGFIYEGVPS